MKHKFEVVGHPEKELWFFPFAASGDIADGVGFEHGKKDGAWVLAFKDLEKMLEWARVARARPGRSHPVILREHGIVADESDVN